MALTIHPIQQSVRSIYNQVLEELTGTNNSVVVFAHFGDFTSAKVDHAFRTVEDSLAERGLRRSTVKRFCNVLIETLQNITKHAAHDSEGRSHSFTVVAGNDKEERLICGNLVMASEMERLNKRISQLNAMSTAEVRKLFIETLCNDDFSSKSGAGLGLMMIAKKLEHNIRFELTKLNDKLGYFKIDLAVPH
ncbi:MAG: SiaB family protein kinase [Flavobacteriales bacterium]|mgnify:CR=1 FL=1|nr:SiaB family protein kinase [Flavobacteriales bacterium]